MSSFNRDVLVLILEELKSDKKSLFSCLLVNRTWCLIAVRILWRNPWQYFTTINSKIIMLFNVLFLHLSKESRDILKGQGIDNHITESHECPLFDYINFIKYLDFFFIRCMIPRKTKKTKISIVKSEIFKLFINNNTKFIHLSIPQNFYNQIHLIPGAEHCFSELESFHCNMDISQNILEWLVRCKSIKKVIIENMFFNYSVKCLEIIKLIEAQESLNDVKFINLSESYESFDKSLEKSLIKHATTIQYLRFDWTPILKFLLHFVNLSCLEIFLPGYSVWKDLNYFENISLPNLKILRTSRVRPIILTNLIENIKGNLTEISVLYDYHGDDSKMFIQAIYRKCPNLRYLRLSLLLFRNIELLISEYESLLSNSRYLNGLIIDIYTGYNTEFKWNEFFMILAKSSPISLFKFKFSSNKLIQLKDIKLFFDNWENRNSIILEISNKDYNVNIKAKQQLEDLIKKYKVKGIVDRYSIGFNTVYHENEFEWN
ncbi:hypothetical protein RhiirA1_532484 [Rhizophagus irregularis]|uniref:F-box domain-containing protein n=1 Tax=Rhizophagus irregularis TaxID=588596 RepID=A0A2N0S5B8_9GLOM|nr:hypothetical protein RhiirA1_532484 [Rhizophagus irregularis]